MPRYVVQRWKKIGFVMGATIALTAMIVGIGLRPAAAGGATEAMKSTIDEVLKILGDKDLKHPEKSAQRRKMLEKVVGDRFDYAEMSRRSLGSTWTGLSAPEREEFVGLFQTLLVSTYAEKVETYSGEGVHYLSERTEKDYAEVRTKVLTGKTEIPLDYRLLNRDSVWRVYDVVVDGVSLVNNYRGQFSKILKNGSFAELVDQLRKKSEKIRTS
ncbi:putative ABC transporter, auxiliary component, ATP-dependent toluene efflux transporter [Nitrospira japonica]|uniref:Putative ABC transporter, auxiliary component, ATP-dependent toluene efflux transporter n=1 Tax=Nitrospira japonica TaxID=1325564 RepID=A0A1W1I5A9_9BACT|nr:ABC transporter substrate-binding protein [Nitrospira japonica]SLM48013.1 putative ABC transporter, auxiliary component, ATP-dependent toluene efflux transporter [Nitrospira japonica]